MLTLDQLDQLARAADPIVASPGTGARRLESIGTFERAATPYRMLVRSARLIVVGGQQIGPELEQELRRGALALARVRERLGFGVADG